MPPRFWARDGTNENLKKILIKSGVSADRLVSVGHGSNKPITGNETTEGRALNRRVELIVEDNEENAVFIKALSSIFGEVTELIETRDDAPQVPAEEEVAVADTVTTDTVVVAVVETVEADTIAVAAHVTLYARYTANVYTVTFDARGEVTRTSGQTPSTRHTAADCRIANRSYLPPNNMRDDLGFRVIFVEE